MTTTLVKVSAFFVRNWRMTRRNTFTLFEVAFWPVVGLLGGLDRQEGKEGQRPLAGEG